jgi:hypothetical protein
LRCIRKKRITIFPSLFTGSNAKPRESGTRIDLRRL